MSTDAVKWAMDDAPMLRTEKGKPDTTARHVLQALAEHAHPDGSNAHPSVLRIQYRTGYDRTTVQRALRRLEKGGLIIRGGVREGRTCWLLAMKLVRPESDWKDLEGEEDATRAAAAERKRRSRAKSVTHAESVTVTDSKDVTVTHAESVTGDVTDSAPSRHALKVRPSRTERRPNHQQPQASQLAQPDSLTYGIPTDARPLVDGLTAAGVVVRWPFQGNSWFPLLALIKKSGVRAMIDHARKANARTNVESATYFMRGWSELPPLPADRTASPRPADKPPHCGDIDCDPIDRMREIETPDGIRMNTPCHQCHPSRLNGKQPAA